MTGFVRVCRYCSRQVTPSDRAALCGRCLSAHHEACWERNGRCSTFRCGGPPMTMGGADIAGAVTALLARGDGEPGTCAFCGGRVYPGTVAARGRAAGSQGTVPGLRFVPASAGGARGLARLWTRSSGARPTFLPGAQLPARSCGQCRRLYLRGRAVDDKSVRSTPGEDQVERWCPRCTTRLTPGHVALRPGEQGARFACDETPEFHSDWFGRNIIDRFLRSRWDVNARAVPAAMCPACMYTEVDGRPVYRFE